MNIFFFHRNGIADKEVLDMIIKRKEGKELLLKSMKFDDEAKNEEIYTSSIVSHCWSYNYFFDFTKARIVSSLISTSHLNFNEDFYILKNSNNLINDLSSTLISDSWKLLV